MPRTALIALIGVTGWMLTADAPALGQEAPFQAVVTSDKVNVRSGSSTNHYTVTQLAKGDIVQVHENIYGWYSITPPAGSFSYIAKEFVKLDDGGKTGLVTGQRVRVRAPSPAGPEQSYKIQVLLDAGAKVLVLGEQDKFLKIAPPPDAKLYISQEFLARATPQQIAAFAQKSSGVPPAADVPAAPPATAPAAPLSASDSGKASPVVPAAPPAAPAAPESPLAMKPADPAARDQAPTELPKVNTHPTVHVTLKDDGAILIDQQSYDAAGYDQQLKKLLDKDPDTALVIKGSDKVGIDMLTHLVAQTRAAGVRHVSLAADKPADAPAVPAVPGPADKPAMPAEAVIVPSAPKTTAQKLAEVESRFADAAKKPLADQPVAALRMEYETLLAAEDLPSADRQLVKHRLELLQDRQQLQEAVTRMDSLKQQMLDSQKRREETDARKPKAYTAVGRLISSSLYTGDKLPRLYRLVDALSGLTIAYVQTPGVETEIHGKVNSMLGQYVGVIGAKQYDPALKLTIILVNEIDALTPVQQP